MADAFNWTCPHCNHAQAVSSDRMHQFHEHFILGKHVHKSAGLTGWVIACANPNCEELTVRISLIRDVWSSNLGKHVRLAETPELAAARLRPESAAKPQPAFIPQALRDDYAEACRIVDLSPKAAATLARRCLQGMIRDFCGIAKGTLAQEIKALRGAVDAGDAPAGVTSESVEAIDHVRSVGNIGAHMEKDIDIIVSVDPGEAAILIELIESLFDEWYVARERRKQRFARLADIAAEKQLQRTVEATDVSGSAK